MTRAQAHYDEYEERRTKSEKERKRERRRTKAVPVDDGRIAGVEIEHALGGVERDLLLLLRCHHGPGRVQPLKHVP
jgi:hypothetical protein